jgi:hypothetical protein
MAIVSDAPGFAGHRPEEIRETGVVTASCHCGSIRIDIDSPPTEVTDCNCSICRRYGALWAYYSLRQVRFTPADPRTDVYMWDDRSLQFHRCKICGCVTHWAPVDKAHDRMGINARLMDLPVLGAARVRRLDGANSERYLDE